MDVDEILEQERLGSLQFFLDFTNLQPDSAGFGLTVDVSSQPERASIAATGFALTAWVIACAHGVLDRARAVEIVRGTLHTLWERVPQVHGFFSHFVDRYTAQRWKLCEYSTIDTALCLNGIITAEAYFNDAEVSDLAEQILRRVDWQWLVFNKQGKTLFRMAYNPDREGDYVEGQPGWIGQWDMSAEQKMMYLQAAGSLEAGLAQQLYAGFRRDIGQFAGVEVIYNPSGNLFAYQFSEAWLDVGHYVDPDGVDWFENTRRAAWANRAFCIQEQGQFATYHQRSWGISCGDSPWGYEISGSPPCVGQPQHSGTVSIYGALSCLPFLPEETRDLVAYLYHEQPQTWGRYGFYDAYHVGVEPHWYSHRLYGIDKGCSLLMIENAQTHLVWDVYTDSAAIQHGLRVLGFRQR
jgi:hypothetical protein